MVTIPITTFSIDAEYIAPLAFVIDDQRSGMPHARASLFGFANLSKNLFIFKLMKVPLCIGLLTSRDLTRADPRASDRIQGLILFLPWQKHEVSVPARAGTRGSSGRTHFEGNGSISAQRQRLLNYQIRSFLFAARCGRPDDECLVELSVGAKSGDLSCLHVQ